MCNKDLAGVTVFAIFDNEFHIAPLGQMSHYNWLVEGHYMCEFAFSGTVLGHIDNSGVYFYLTGGATNGLVESVAAVWGTRLVSTYTLPVYCGLADGKAGSACKGCKRIL